MHDVKYHVIIYKYEYLALSFEYVLCDPCYCIEEMPDGFD